VPVSPACATGEPARAAQPPAGGFEERACRIAAAERVVQGLDPQARQAAGELAAALGDCHDTVLRAFVTRLRSDERGRELLFEIVEAPEVYAALAKAA